MARVPPNDGLYLQTLGVVSTVEFRATCPLVVKGETMPETLHGDLVVAIASIIAVIVGAVVGSYL